MANVKILLRAGTAASLADVVLDSKEPAFATDTGEFKVGDGVTTFADLSVASSNYIRDLLVAASPGEGQIPVVRSGAIDWEDKPSGAGSTDLGLGTNDASGTQVTSSSGNDVTIPRATTTTGGTDIKRWVFDTEANHTSVDPTIDGVAYYATDIKRFKLGDGTTSYDNLEYDNEISLGEPIFYFGNYRLELSTEGEWQWINNENDEIFIIDANSGALTLTPGVTPTTNPEAGKYKFYLKNDGNLYLMNDAGVEVAAAGITYTAGTNIDITGAAISIDIDSNLDLNANRISDLPVSSEGSFSTALYLPAVALGDIDAQTGSYATGIGAVDANELAFIVNGFPLMYAPNTSVLRFSKPADVAGGLAAVTNYMEIVYSSGIEGSITLYGGALIGKDEGAVIADLTDFSGSGLNGKIALYNNQTGDTWEVRDGGLVLYSINKTTGAITAGAINGVTLSSSGSATNFLNEEGNYVSVGGGGGATNITVSEAVSTVEIQSSSGTNDSIDAATTSLAGVMSASDKTKLDGIATGAEVNVNADWNSVSGDSQILNKPTLGTLAGLSEINTTHIEAATLVISSEGIASNNNDTTIPTSAAVKAYADSVAGGGGGSSWGDSVSSNTTYKIGSNDATASTWLITGVSDVTIDGDGYTITEDASNANPLLRIGTGCERITIKNFNFVGQDTGSYDANSIAIEIDGATPPEHVRIQDCNFRGFDNKCVDIQENGGTNEVEGVTVVGCGFYDCQTANNSNQVAINTGVDAEYIHIKDCRFHNVPRAVHIGTANLMILDCFITDLNGDNTSGEPSASDGLIYGDISAISNAGKITIANCQINHNDTQLYPINLILNDTKYDNAVKLIGNDILINNSNTASYAQVRLEACHNAILTANNIRCRGTAVANNAVVHFVDCDSVWMGGNQLSDGDYSIECETSANDKECTIYISKQNNNNDGNSDTAPATGNVIYSGTTPTTGKRYVVYDNLIEKEVAASDLTTALTTGDDKAYIPIGYDFYIEDLKAQVFTAPTGSAIGVMLNDDGVDILSAVLTIPAASKTSTTYTFTSEAARHITDGSQIIVDLDSIGSTVAGAGLIVTLQGYRKF